MADYQQMYIDEGFALAKKMETESWQQAYERMVARRDAVLSRVNTWMTDEERQINRHKIEEWEITWGGQMSPDLTRMMTYLLVDHDEFHVPRHYDLDDRWWDDIGWNRWHWKRGIFFNRSKVIHLERRERWPYEFAASTRRGLDDALIIDGLSQYELDGVIARIERSVTETENMETPYEGTECWGGFRIATLVNNEILGGSEDRDGYGRGAQLVVVDRGPHRGELWVYDRAPYGFCVHPFGEAIGDYRRTYDLIDYVVMTSIKGKKVVFSPKICQSEQEIMDEYKFNLEHHWVIPPKAFLFDDQWEPSKGRGEGLQCADGTMIFKTGEVEYPNGVIRYPNNDVLDSRGEYRVAEEEDVEVRQIGPHSVMIIYANGDILHPDGTFYYHAPNPHLVYWEDVHKMLAQCKAKTAIDAEEDDEEEDGELSDSDSNDEDVVEDDDDDDENVGESVAAH